MSIKICKYCKVGIMVLRKGKYSDFYGCSRYPDCAGVEKIKHNDRKSLDEKANEMLGEKPL